MEAGRSRTARLAPRLSSKPIRGQARILGVCVRDTLLPPSVAAVVVVFLCQPARVGDPSTLLRLTAEHRILAGKITCRFDSIECGDVVALRFPGHPLHSCPKRVVGLTGKTVEMRNGSKRLRYGENARRQTALHADGRAGVGSATHLRGKVSSHNSFADLDASWHLSLEFDRPAAATVRRTIPCGLGEGTIPAMGRLHSGNPVRRQYTRHPPALSSWVPATTSP